MNFRGETSNTLSKEQLVIYKQLTYMIGRDLMCQSDGKVAILNGMGIYRIEDG